jgi:K+-transporting ATPase KdpF subunit
VVLRARVGAIVSLDYALGFAISLLLLAYLVYALLRAEKF